ncbi:MAG: tail fiber domain-containing protein [Verrucomicrobiales bacterium]
MPQSFATGVRVLYDPSQSAGQIYTYDYTNNTGKQLKLGVPGGGAGYDPGIVFSDPIVSDAIFKEDIFLEGYLYNWWDGAYRTLSRDSITGNAHWSDERLKEEIATIPDALSTLHQLRGVKFQWNEEGISRLTSNIETEYRSKSGTKEDNEALWAEKRAEAEEKLSQTQYGFIAQELEKVFPDWVLTGEDGYKKINVEQMTGVIVQGVNELNERTTAQAATIADLQSENASLKSQLAALEKQIADQAALDAKIEARLARLEKAADTKKQTVSLK